mgnify:CR=1 FL=1
MALKSPAFRKKFPLLVTGSLLAMQPLAVPFVFAEEQYDCSASASGGWDCAPKANTAQLPPRPSHNGTVAQANGESGEQGEQTPLVTSAKGRGLKARSADYSHLDWVPRDKLTAAQLAETGPYCGGAYIEPTRPGMNDKTNKSDAPTFIGAKASRYEQEQQVATLAGDVVMRQGSMQVEADEANLGKTRFLAAAGHDILQPLNAARLYATSPDMFSHQETAAFAALAGETVLNDHDYQRATHDWLAAEQIYLYQALRALPALRLWRPAANYLFFRCEHTDLQARLLLHHILIRHCANYPGLDGRYYRVAIRSHADNQRLVEALQQVLQDEVMPAEVLQHRASAHG